MNKPDESEQKHVLIVDDDPEITESIRFALKSAGFRVSIARDGNQGVAIAETKEPHLVILDMMMPGTKWSLLQKWSGHSTVFSRSITTRQMFG